jgi:hypothetical protein
MSIVFAGGLSAVCLGLAKWLGWAKKADQDKLSRYDFA